MITQEETHIMQLAWIMTATVLNTDSTIKNRIGRDHPYWTQAYAGVCLAIDREMRERKRAEKAEAERNLSNRLESLRRETIGTLSAALRELCSLRISGGDSEHKQAFVILPDKCWPLKVETTLGEAMKL